MPKKLFYCCHYKYLTKQDLAKIYNRYQSINIRSKKIVGNYVDIFRHHQIDLDRQSLTGYYNRDRRLMIESDWVLL